MTEETSRSPDLMTPDQTALLVVDLQERMTVAVADGQRVVWNARRLLDAADALGVAAAITEQAPDKMGPTVTTLAERKAPIHDKVCFSSAACGEIFSAWRDEGRGAILICGMESHICIQQTALDLLADGWNVLVAVDAIGSRFPIDHDIALRRMECSGVVLTTTEAAMFEWCRTAASPQFKAISALAKEAAPNQ